MASTARQDMIVSAIQLFRERGIDGTAFSDVIEHSGAPRGSIYHHFPGGKAQLVREATEAAGRFVQAGIEAVVAGTNDPREVLDAFVDAWRLLLQQSDFAAGCSIAAAAIASPEVAGASQAAGEVFARWDDVLSAAFRGQGIDPVRATSLAMLTIAALEGAILLCRSTRTFDPLDRVRDELALALVAATPAR